MGVLFGGGRGLAAAGLAAGLAACAPLVVPEPAQVPGAPAPAGACGAAALQGLVGTSVGSLQASALPQPNRVIFPGMSVTMDFRPERLNVEVGRDDRITRVYCG